MVDQVVAGITWKQTISNIELTQTQWSRKIKYLGDIAKIVGRSQRQNSSNDVKELAKVSKSVRTRKEERKHKNNMDWETKK